MTKEELEKLKRYLRIDYLDDEEENDLKNFYQRAKISIKNKVGHIDFSNADAKEQFEQACALLVEHWYDNRQAFRIGNASYEIPHSLDSILRELRYCYVGDSNETN
ncbi:head-tail connector protein [Pseudogracilibacillus auburnensis]|uniref:Putative phage protein (Predicted DNA packaging) n=1 Tax=Pseudogracilibacillus auburnensis TaxID=1494959 RepID=A0A2V3WJ67_9BACI|nr:head-tail connector protein [Pseudogracilibacillus auburnensis]MBO1003740.1 phage gp6-like head-tail connector protein [Pseudogracilibacillus auburnensis]PXW88819.1 putative phage protein (predicted DNA packaging) [Pseudogracilibacillus auburnensis]